MNFSRLEQITILFTALILAFLAGWFFCRQQEAALVFTPAAVESSVPPSEVTQTPDNTQAPAVKRVNINTADAAQLQILPGIGEKRAADIISYRETHGPFSIPEAITDVPGIGSATLNEIIDLITVEDES